MSEKPTHTAFVSAEESRLSEERLLLLNESLRKSEERYHQMIAEIQDYAIILLDKDGIIQNWNKGAEKIKLYTEQEIVGNHFSIFYQVDDQRKGLPQQLIRQATEEGHATHEGWRVRKDRTKFWGSVSITALHGVNGEIIGFSKVTRDLTERKLAEDRQNIVTSELRQMNEQLKLSEERYHQMVAEVQDYAIILLDVNGNIENWNAGAELIKGYGSEVIGKNIRVFYTQEDLEVNLPEKLLNEARENGRAFHEGWRVRKNGSKFWGSIVITALHNKEGVLIGFSKVTRDLTEKKATEDRLAEYTRELELQNRELEQFAYVASHDLQEPLRKIQTFSDIIQRNIADESMVNRYFEKIARSAKRMSELIKSVLNYSKLAKESLELNDIDLNEIVSSALSDFELLIEERAAKVKTDKLPVVKGSRLQLSQVFANLISNALKFSDKNPFIQIRSKIVSRQQVINQPEFLTSTEYFEIGVTDNGIGFDQQYESLIFAMFQRLHGKQTFAGTGIGLALCKKIMENHGGYITARGEVGKGATFYIYFPVFHNLVA